MDTSSITKKSVLKALTNRASRSHKGEKVRSKMKQILGRIGIIGEGESVPPTAGAKARRVLAQLVADGTVAQDGERSSRTYRRL